RHDSLGSGQDATPCGYRADAQQIICSRLTPDQMICLREGKNTQNLELQYKWEETMLISALVLGILGGLFGLLIGLFGYTLGGIAGLGGLQALSMAIPIVSIVGGAMAKAKPIAAGSLMILSSVGMFCVFGFNFFTAIPLVLSAVGGLLAIAGMSEATQVVSTQPAPSLEPVAPSPSVGQPAPPSSPDTPPTEMRAPDTGITEQGDNETVLVNTRSSPVLSAEPTPTRSREHSPNPPLARPSTLTGEYKTPSPRGVVADA